jgi:hypothetical protein
MSSNGVANGRGASSTRPLISKNNKVHTDMCCGEMKPFHYHR